MHMSRQLVEVEDTGRKPRRFVFVLLDQFSLLCFATAIESLRIANRMMGREVYTWTLLAEGGRTVSCSAGTSFQVDDDLVEFTRLSEQQVIPTPPIDNPY